MKDKITELELELAKAGISQLGIMRTSSKWVATATHRLNLINGKGESLLEAFEDLIAKHRQREVTRLLSSSD